MSEEQRIEAYVRSDVVETIAMNALQNFPNVPFIKAKDLFDSQYCSSSLKLFFYVTTKLATG